MIRVPSPSDRFSANLRGLRDLSGLTQEELAFRSAIHRTQISLLECGGRLPRVETLVKLAGSLRTTPNDLLDGIAWHPIEVVAGGLVVVSSEGGGDG